MKITIDNTHYNINAPLPIYIAPAPYFVQKGIDMFNRGEPKPARPVRPAFDSQNDCDMRMGWIIGEAAAIRAAR